MIRAELSLTVDTDEELQAIAGGGSFLVDVPAQVDVVVQGQLTSETVNVALVEQASVYDRNEPRTGPRARVHLTRPEEA